MGGEQPRRYRRQRKEPERLICQEKLFNPGQDVSINPDNDSILTHSISTPDVRLGHTPTCRSRIRHQAAAGSWTMPRQWEIQRTWLNSAWAAVRSPAKPNGV